MKKKILLPIFASFMLFTGIGSTTAEAATQSQLTSEAYKYLGIKYRYGGTSTAGFDCSGFTQYVMKKLGISIPRTTGSQWATGTAVSKANLKVGDLVFFNTIGRTASHVGIYVGGGNFIHAGTVGGVQISNLNSSYWAPKFNGGRRVANFTSETAQVTQQAKQTQPAQQPKAAAAPTKATFDPKIHMKRGEVAKKVANALGLDTTNKNTPFTDVPSNADYAGAVKALYDKGIFIGKGNNEFDPNGPLTREEVAKILTLAYDLKHKGGQKNFADVSKSNWSYEFVEILASNNVTEGIGKNLFGRTDYVEKAHMDLFIERANKAK